MNMPNINPVQHGLPTRERNYTEKRTRRDRFRLTQTLAGSQPLVWNLGVPAGFECVVERVNFSITNSAGVENDFLVQFAIGLDTIHTCAVPVQTGQSATCTAAPGLTTTVPPSSVMGVALDFLDIAMPVMVFRENFQVSISANGAYQITFGEVTVYTRPI